MTRILGFLLHLWREVTRYYDKPVPYVIVRDWRQDCSEEVEK